MHVRLPQVDCECGRAPPSPQWYRLEDPRPWAAVSTMCKAWWGLCPPLPPGAWRAVSSHLNFNCRPGLKSGSSGSPPTTAQAVPGPACRARWVTPLALGSRVGVRRGLSPGLNGHFSVEQRSRTFFHVFLRVSYFFLDQMSIRIFFAHFNGLENLIIEF